MGNLPRPGMEPMSPALAGRFLTTGPPGKSEIMDIITEGKQGALHAVSDCKFPEHHCDIFTWFLSSHEPSCPFLPFRIYCVGFCLFHGASPVVLVVKNPPAKARDIKLPLFFQLLQNLLFFDYPHQYQKGPLTEQ